MMRSKKEMYDLILNEAKNNPHIKAVMLNGSRTNLNVTKDRLQDFDIVYVVDQMEYFLNNDYVKRFGEVAIMQTPNKMTLFESENSETFAYLM